MTTAELVAPVARHRRTDVWSARWSRTLALTTILAGQALLSVRLVSSRIAGPDEARYIVAGHQLIYELWHGGGSPYYETYFSGAPDIYSPLAAMADNVGGLVAVRLMSLVLMLAATALLYASTSRLFGTWSAVAAAGLFAGLGLTHDLGVYANYDALALALLAGATYCAVRTGPTDELANRWLLAVPLVLLAANAAKYMTVVFDPVIIGVAAFQIGEQGWRPVTRRCLALAAATVSLLLLATYLAGTAYIKGIMFTTLARKGGTQVVLAATATPAHVIISESWRWIGVIVAVGVLALLAAALNRAGQTRTRTGLLALLVVAGVLVTLEALRLHSDESMRQHDDFGAWFTCIAAGYLIPAFARQLVPRATGVACALGVAGLVTVSGMHYATIDRTTYEGGLGNALSFYALVKPYLELPNGRFLAGGFTNFQLMYVDQVAVPWFQMYDDVYFKYPIPGRGGDTHGERAGQVCFSLRPGCMYLEGPAAYQAAIHAHFFALVSLYGDHRGSADDLAIERATAHTPGYVLLTATGLAPTWIYAPAYRASRG